MKNNVENVHLVKKLSSKIMSVGFLGDFHGDNVTLDMAQMYDDLCYDFPAQVLTCETPEQLISYVANKIVILFKRFVKNIHAHGDVNDENDETIREGMSEFIASLADAFDLLGNNIPLDCWLALYDLYDKYGADLNDYYWPEEMVSIQDFRKKRIALYTENGWK